MLKLVVAVGLYAILVTIIVIKQFKFRFAHYCEQCSYWIERKKEVYSTDDDVFSHWMKKDIKLSPPYNDVIPPPKKPPYWLFRRLAKSLK